MPKSEAVEETEPSPVILTAARVEVFGLGEKWGWRTATETGDVVHEERPKYKTPAEATEAAKADERTAGLTLT